MQVDNNVGSGKPDFFAYAPTLDLRQYDENDTLHFRLYMEGVKQGPGTGTHQRRDAADQRGA
jgi:hypothetical protein